MSQGFVSGGFNAKCAGDVVQIQRYQTGGVATGTTVIPHDDTIPQITEGDEYMTVAITPTNINSLLKIDVVFIAASANDYLTAALFQDATAGALAAGVEESSSGANYTRTVRFTHYMTAGTISATTFRVRGGGTAGTMTFNGVSSARLFGGVMASSITVTEYASGTLIREAGSNIAGNIAVAKAWCQFNGSGTPAMTGTPYNMSTSITDGGTGLYTLTFTTPFSSANYVLVGCADDGGAGQNAGVSVVSKTVSTISIRVARESDNTAVDATIIMLVFFGNQ